MPTVHDSGFSARSQLCVVLIATCDRLPLLLERSLPSVAAQLVEPVGVVLVNDGTPFKRSEIHAVEAILGHIPLVSLANDGARGAAGAWNTGIRYLAQRDFTGYLAILDDDDSWEVDHLSLNMETARGANADVVVSGLRHITSVGVKETKLCEALKPTDFYVGNPGWQGSNTFVRMQAMLDAGGFREGLPSCNDRDLAVRLLSQPALRVCYTNHWTANWYADGSSQTLSSPGTTSKRDGLRWFWHLYGDFMTDEQRAAFFERAARLFLVGRAEITTWDGQIPPGGGLLPQLTA